MQPDNEPDQLGMGRSLGDQLYLEAKALGSGIPFPSQGGFGGMVPVYSSWDSWDAAMDMRAGGVGQNSVASYIAKVGDLAQNSLLVAAIKWLGNTWPQAKLIVKKRKGDAKPDDDEVVWDHAMTKLWNRPNKYYAGSTMRRAIAFSWILRSEAYIIKFMNSAGTQPVEMWWEPHWTIRPVWPLNGGEFISYYEVNRNGVWYPLPVENVIHLRDGLNPYNQRLGFSGVPSVLRELYGDQEAAAYYATLMGGSAVPPFMVSLDKDMRMDQGAVDAFTADLVRKTSGKYRGRPIVAKGARAYKLGMTPKELSLNESRYMAEDRFCAVMGIPAVVLELGSGQAHSIYNNVKQAEERAWNSFIGPMLTYMAEEIDVQLLEDFEGEDSGYYTDFDTSKVQALQEDESEKAKRAGLMYDDGIAMRSEARSMVNLGPSDPDNPDVDKVFKDEKTASLIKPGEDPLSTLDTVPGETPPAPAAGKPGKPQPATNGGPPTPAKPTPATASA